MKSAYHSLVFSGDLLVIFPTTSKFENAIIRSWGIQGGLISLDSAIFKHIEIVVTSFSFVIELRNSEKVSVTFARNRFQLCWRSDNFENGGGDQINTFVALRDVVEWVVGIFIPAATSDGHTLELKVRK